MAFRNPPTSTGGGGSVAVGTPTKAVDIGDTFEQGASGTYADAHHQHAVPGPAAGSAQPVNATGGDSDSTDTAAARSRHSHAHTRTMHLAGGHADLSGDFVGFTAGDGRYAPLTHGARHQPGGLDDLSGVFVPFNLIQGKGDLLLGSAPSTMVRRAVGADGTVLTADAAAPGGAKWAAAGATSYEPVAFKIRKASMPDGIDLGGVLLPSINPGTLTFSTNVATVAAFKVWASGFLYTFADTAVTVPFAAASTALGIMVVRIDNAAGGPDNATLAVKRSAEGAFTYPTVQQDDLSASTTAVYEIEIARFQINTGSLGALVDTRTIARGGDGQPGTMIKLAEVLVGFSDTLTAVTFAKIPSSFRDLRLVFSARSKRAGINVDGMGLRFNGDATANYNRTRILTSAAAVTPSGSAGATEALIGDIPAATATSNRFAGGLVEIPDFGRASAAHTRHILSRSYSPDGSHCIDQAEWQQTVQVHSATVLSTTGSEFAQNTRLALYGIR